MSRTPRAKHLHVACLPTKLNRWLSRTCAGSARTAPRRGWRCFWRWRPWCSIGRMGWGGGLGIGGVWGGWAVGLSLMGKHPMLGFPGTPLFRNFRYPRTSKDWARRLDIGACALTLQLGQGIFLRSLCLKVWQPVKPCLGPPARCPFTVSVFGRRVPLLK